MRTMIVVGLLIGGSAIAVGETSHKDLTDEQIAQLIVTNSRAKHAATGRPCGCPDDLQPDGNRCGQRSAYPRLAGAPTCYTTDVTKAEIDAYRKRPRSGGLW